MNIYDDNQDVSWIPECYLFSDHDDVHNNDDVDKEDSDDDENRTISFMTMMNDDDDIDDSALSISIDSQKALLFPILKSIVILFMNCIRPQGPKN